MEPTVDIEDFLRTVGKALKASTNAQARSHGPWQRDPEVIAAWNEAKRASDRLWPRQQASELYAN